MQTPKIGNNVWIGPGVKIYGKIILDSQIQIGANSVVNKSFKSDITIAGIPAKIIKDSGTSAIDVSANINRVKDFFIQYPKHKKFE